MRDDMHDHIGDSPTPSGVETPRPDLSDKRLPGIAPGYAPGYFGLGQVGSGSSQSSPSRSLCVLTTPNVDSGVESHPTKHVRETLESRWSSAWSGSMVTVERGQDRNLTPPPQPDEPLQKPALGLPLSDASRLPPTPISSASSFLHRDGEVVENGKPIMEGTISSVTQALRNFIFPKSSSSIKARRHQSLPVSSVNTSTVPAAHLSNPTSSVHSPSRQSPAVSSTPSNKPKTSKSFKELSKLTADAAPESRNKSTPPLSPRALSQEGGHPGKRSPLSSTSTNAASSDTAVESEIESSQSSQRSERLPTNTPRGKLAVKISEGRNLKPAYDPYIVCTFEWNEYISQGPKHDAMDLDVDEKKGPIEKLASVPIRRTDSDSGKPMAIPMKSRQSSSNGMSDNEGRPLEKVTKFRWNHEAVLLVSS
jgi:serine/threonine protein kinase SCH9